jgi:protein involved in polysaccharide export with SLBB domain
MTTGSSVFKAKGGIFLALRVLGVLFFSILLLGCATSREDDYVASMIAEALTNDVPGEEILPDTIPSEDQPDATIAIPAVVSVTPSGTLSANPVAAVSVTVPAQSTVITSSVPAEESPAPAVVPPADVREPVVKPKASPVPEAVVAPLVTVPVQPVVPAQQAVPVVKELPVSEVTNTVPGWPMAMMLKPSDPTIQPDSVLWISVTEDPSLNGRYVVNSSSAIDFGYVGLVFLQDMTVQQAEAVIKNVLEGRYLNKATVSVKIAKASYDSVGVLGNVETPGEIKIGPGDTITLSDALRRAGGLRGNRDSNRVKIVRGGLRSPFGPAAEGEVLSLISARGELQIPAAFLRNNDLAYVFAAESSQISGLGKRTGVGKRVILLGEVPRRGVIEFAENEPCTLMYLLFKIGGLPRFAKADRIKIVRRAKDGQEKTFVVDGSQLMDKGAPEDDIVLESGDRVIVPARKIAFF